MAREKARLRAEAPGPPFDQIARGACSGFLLARANTKKMAVSSDTEWKYPDHRSWPGQRLQDRTSM